MPLPIIISRVSMPLFRRFRCFCRHFLFAADFDISSRRRLSATILIFRRYLFIYYHFDAIYTPLLLFAILLLPLPPLIAFVSIFLRHFAIFAADYADYFRSPAAMLPLILIFAFIFHFSAS